MRGLAAGAVATAAMTGYQLLLARLRGQEDGAQPRSWKDAPAPAQVGKRLLSGVFRERVGLDQVDRLTNAMHWSYGTAWGGMYGLLRESAQALPTPGAGAAFGAGVWGMSYAQLVPMGIYEPPWNYPARELALDLSYHLVYGLTAAIAYKTLTSRL